MSSPASLPPTSPTARSEPQAAPHITLSGSERWLFCGKTGSGKSFLARELLKTMAAKGWRVVIIDIQGMWIGRRPQWEKRGPGTVDRPRLVTAFDPKLAVQLYIPRTPGYLDAGLDAFLEAIYQAGDTIVYFDELFGVVTATKYSDAFAKVWTQGRKLNVAAWCATQRPRRIPEIVVSQAENYAIFRIASVEDRKYLAGYTGSPEVARVAIPSRYWWYLHQETMDRAALMQPIQAKNASVANRAGGKGNVTRASA